MKLIESLCRFMKSFHRSRLFWSQSSCSVSEEFSFFPLEVLQIAGERALSRFLARAAAAAEHRDLSSKVCVYRGDLSKNT